MLIIRMDVNGKHQAAQIAIRRVEPHFRLKHHFWYKYRATDDDNNVYRGVVLHDYENGAFALTQKVTKAIVIQQKAQKAIA